MKNIILALVVLLFFDGETESQVVKGKIVDENQTGLAGIELKLYIEPNIQTTTTTTNGSFTFQNVTEVEDERLPIRYAVSNNFPNPFNPITRISITLPDRSNVRIEVFNILGQNVKEIVEQNFDAGTNYVDIELNGLPNGMYIARIIIDNKYTVVKKMMLVHGSQHLTTGGNIRNAQVSKSNNNYNIYRETNLDSLIASSSIIGEKTFKNLPSLTGDTLDLGNLTIERYCIGTPTVTYGGKTYNTVQIGSQCWLKENLDVGTMIMMTYDQDQTDNDTTEKFCYDNYPNNCATYGGIYQWNETMQYSITPGTQGICPSGWHIPTFSEFQTLAITVNYDQNALKSIGQGNGTNTSGFSALFAGYFHKYGPFTNLGTDAMFWSSTEYNSFDGNFMWVSYYEDIGISILPYAKNEGFCVRCIKD